MKTAGANELAAANNRFDDLMSPPGLNMGIRKTSRIKRQSHGDHEGFARSSPPCGLGVSVTLRGSISGSGPATYFIAASIASFSCWGVSSGLKPTNTFLILPSLPTTTVSGIALALYA